MYIVYTSEHEADWWAWKNYVQHLGGCENIQIPVPTHPHKQYQNLKNVYRVLFVGDNDHHPSHPHKGKSVNSLKYSLWN